MSFSVDQDIIQSCYAIQCGAIRYNATGLSFCSNIIYHRAMPCNVHNMICSGDMSLSVQHYDVIIRLGYIC